jgi:hypothetical protein
MKSERVIYFFFSYMYRVIHFKSSPAAHEPLHMQNDKTNGNIEFLQLYPVVAADALLEISMPVISAVL